MVGQHKELTFFKVVLKVTNGKVDCEEFKTECAVLDFGGLEAF